MKMLRDTRILYARSLRDGIRNPVTGFVFPAVFPVIVVWFISQIYSALAKLPSFPTHDYATYLAPGAILLAPMMGSGYAAAALVLDAESGFLDRVRLLPVRAASVLGARFLFEATRVLPGAIVVFLIVRGLGSGVQLTPASFAVVLAMAAGWSAAYSGFFYVTALSSMRPQAPMALLPLCLPLLFVSPALIPEIYLPSWIRGVAWWNPYTYLVQGARSVTTGHLAAAPLLRAGLTIVLVFAITYGATRVLYARRTAAA